MLLPLCYIRPIMHCDVVIACALNVLRLHRHTHLYKWFLPLLTIVNCRIPNYVGEHVAFLLTIFIDHNKVHDLQCNYDIRFSLKLFKEQIFFELLNLWYNGWNRVMLVCTKDSGLNLPLSTYCQRKETQYKVISSLSKRPWPCLSGFIPASCF